MHAMLRREDFGPVRFYEFTRRIAGRPVMRVGVYRVGELLIDTGPARARAAAGAILGDGPVGQIVLTHHHEDHVGNAAELARQSGTRPQIHAAGIELVASSAELPMYRRIVWGQPDAVAATELAAEILTERFRFNVIHTPGHAVDHVALHEPDQEWLFVGDLFLTDAPRVAFGYDDVGEIIRSIRTLLAIPDCVMFCQHSGYHASHQHRLGRKLDYLLGLQQRAVVHLEEGRSLREIVRALELGDGHFGWVSRGELSAANLVRGLLQDAGKL